METENKIQYQYYLLLCTLYYAQWLVKFVKVYCTFFKCVLMIMYVVFCVHYVLMVIDENTQPKLNSRMFYKTCYRKLYWGTSILEVSFLCIMSGHSGVGAVGGLFRFVEFFPCQQTNSGLTLLDSPVIFLYGINAVTGNCTSTYSRPQRSLKPLYRCRRSQNLPHKDQCL